MITSNTNIFCELNYLTSNVNRVTEPLASRNHNKEIMKTYALLAIITIVILFAGLTLFSNPKTSNQTTPTVVQNQQTSNQNPSRPTTEQTNAPQFNLTSLDGQQITAQNFHGKPTLLKLGTTYCHVCQQEIPEIKQAYQQLGNQVNLAFVLIGASAKQAQDYKQKYSIEYPIYLDNGQTGRVFNVLGTPTHAFLDSSGNLASRNVGFMSSSQITSTLQKLI